MVLIIILNDIVDYQKYDKNTPIISDKKRTQGTKPKLLQNKKKSKKKGRALAEQLLGIAQTCPASDVCSQFGKLTKLVLGSAKSGCLVRIKRQWAFRINIRPWTIYSRCSLQRTFEGNSHSTVSVASYANRRRLS